MNTRPKKAVWLETGEECKASDLDLAILHSLQFPLALVAHFTFGYEPGCGSALLTSLNDGHNQENTYLLERLERIGLVKRFDNEDKEESGQDFTLLAGFKELM